MRGRGKAHPQEIKEQWPGFLERNRRPDGFEPYDTVVQRSLDWPNWAR